MSDIKFQTYGIIKSYFENLNQQKGRRALIRALGDGNQAIAAADILIYLVWQTFDTDVKLLDQFDSYIVRTNEQIVMATGCSNFNNSSRHIEMLIEKGFILRDIKSFRNKSRYKVNLDLVVSELDRCLIELDQEAKEYTSKQESIKKADEERFKKSTPQNFEIAKAVLEDFHNENISQEDAINILEKVGCVENSDMYNIVALCVTNNIDLSYADYNTIKKFIHESFGNTWTTEAYLKLEEAIKNSDQVSFSKHFGTAVKNYMRGYRNFKEVEDDSLF